MSPLLTLCEHFHQCRQHELSGLSIGIPLGSMTEVKAAFRSLKLYSMESKKKAQRIAAKNVRRDVLHFYFHLLPLKQQV